MKSLYPVVATVLVFMQVAVGKEPEAFRRNYLHQFPVYDGVRNDYYGATTGHPSFSFALLPHQVDLTSKRINAIFPLHENNYLETLPQSLLMTSNLNQNKNGYFDSSGKGTISKKPFNYLAYSDKNSGKTKYHFSIKKPIKLPSVQSERELMTPKATPGMHLTTSSKTGYVRDYPLDEYNHFKVGAQNPFSQNNQIVQHQLAEPWHYNMGYKPLKKTFSYPHKFHFHERRYVPSFSPTQRKTFFSSNNVIFEKYPEPISVMDDQHVLPKHALSYIYEPPISKYSKPQDLSPKEEAHIGQTLNTNTQQAQLTQFWENSDFQKEEDVKRSAIPTLLHDQNRVFSVPHSDRFAFGNQLNLVLQPNPSEMVNFPQTNIVLDNHDTKRTSETLKIPGAVMRESFYSPNIASSEWEKRESFELLTKGYKPIRETTEWTPMDVNIPLKENNIRISSKASLAPQRSSEIITRNMAELASDEYEDQMGVGIEPNNKTLKDSPFKGLTDNRGKIKGTIETLNIFYPDKEVKGLSTSDMVIPATSKVS